MSEKESVLRHQVLPVRLTYLFLFRQRLRLLLLFPLRFTVGSGRIGRCGSAKKVIYISTGHHSFQVILNTCS